MQLRINLFGKEFFEFSTEPVKYIVQMQEKEEESDNHPRNAETQIGFGYIPAGVEFNKPQPFDRHG